MNRVAIAYSTKDRVELTRQTIKPLLKQKGWDLHWFDGSSTKEGKTFYKKFDFKYWHPNVTGGSCRYIVHALTTLLDSNYDFIGLVENDVLLHDGWFDDCMELFERSNREGLVAGAVSARTYEDRVLIQRQGYAVMHNLGAGCIILRRHAAELILKQYRTGMSAENRRLFAVLSGVDIGGYWAFRGSDHMLVADWTWDRMLAQDGMCSLALTPAKATQLEDIEAMGLKLATEPISERVNDQAFAAFQERTTQIRSGEFAFAKRPNDFLYHDNMWTFFAHQLPMLGGVYAGDWRFKWSMAFGCFAWQAGENQPTLTIRLTGPCHFLLSGGDKGAVVRVEDETGYKIEPQLDMEGHNRAVLQLFVPGFVAYRQIKVTALQPGATVYGVRTRDPQPYLPDVGFDFNTLPVLP